MIKVSEKTTKKTANFYDDGLLRIEYENYYATWKGEVIKLSRSEFLLISQLVQKRERYISSEELWKHTWGVTKEFKNRSMRVHICKLRQLLEPHGMKIENLAGVGYRFVPHNNSR